ncbi:MAG: CarD family transcriptional regulator [Lachnospiraceae bacterium]|jgi:hypothetical protein|nr:CarD family transcriptional regulator [Lachnospiraceae bacterium]MDD3617366.1 CarD family transcriptional regulator [Lachnospiraceae bacterium]
MFQKKNIIYSESIGVCRVDDIVKLSVQKEEPILYYLLRSVFDKKKVSYIPVENHQFLLRDLISRKEAENLLQQAGKIQKAPEIKHDEVGKESDKIQNKEIQNKEIQGKEIQAKETQIDDKLIQEAEYVWNLKLEFEDEKSNGKQKIKKH